MRLERARVRLIGFRLSGLGAPQVAAQLALLDDAGGSVVGEGRVPGERWDALDRAADAIAARYGGPAVSFASLLDDEERPGERPADPGGGAGPRIDPRGLR
jgi:hypothetical protein